MHAYGTCSCHFATILYIFNRVNLKPMNSSACPASGAEKWRNYKKQYLVFRAIMELIFAVSVAITVFTVVLLPCIIFCLGVLLVLCIDDSFVSPVVAYVAFPEAVMISGFLLLRYWRQISEFLRSISP
ncbi:hypothetical protein [Pseudomonas putida]|uniref:hypothetical protein n=1 Tax=Pseudomonas putida TaxID=303 RepID=UPI0027475F5B|nr:hypothetical protein [Pseudomonas putida]MDP9523612.1 hypothetical protein [Pseudomonas putida]